MAAWPLGRLGICLCLCTCTSAAAAAATTSSAEEDAGAGGGVSSSSAGVVYAPFTVRGCVPLESMIDEELGTIVLQASGDKDSEAAAAAAAGLPSDIRYVKSARYGTDGDWADVTESVVRHGIALTRESLGGRDAAPWHRLKVVYVRSGVGGEPDFTRVGLRWLERLGLSRAGVYGCAPRQTDAASDGAPLHFAVSCVCPGVQQCKVRTLTYLHNEREYATPMGECGCCSAKVTLVVILLPIVLFGFAAGWARVFCARVVSRLIGPRDKAARKYKKLAPPAPPKPRMTPLSPHSLALTSPRSPNPLEADQVSFSGESGGELHDRGRTPTHTPTSLSNRASGQSHGPSPLTLR